MCNFHYLSYARSRETAFPADDVGCLPSACVWESRKKQRLFIGAKEAKFPYFTKGKPVSSWLVHPLTFFITNMFCFVLSPRSSLIMQRHPPEGLLLMTVRWSERDVFIMFEICIFFLQKCMDSQREAFIHPPELCEACFFMDSHTLFYVFWTV